MFDLSSLSSTEVKKMPKRCECIDCKTKLMLTDLQCKCGKYFCIKHRFASDHKCEFDYKLNSMNHLKDKLVEVKGSSFEKI